jgi:hypothetical protein
VTAGRISRLGAGCALAALLLTGGARAYIQENLVDSTGSDAGLFQGSAFVLRLEQDGAAGIINGTDLTALRDSMARWTGVATSEATITEGALFDLASPIDASQGLGTAGNRLIFAQADANNRIGSAIAVAFFTFGSDGHISDCDIVMNEKNYIFSTATPANPNQVLGAGTYDIGEIATHEMGHCLGLDHSPIAGRFSASTGLEVSGFSSADFTYQATMYPYGTRTIQGRSLSDDDIAGVSFIYPNATLASTRGTISGRVLDGGTFAPVKGAHVVAVTTAAPDVPVVGVVSDVQAGGPGGEFNIVGLAPGSYYLRLEPLVGTSNPFTVGNTHFSSFTTNFPPESYDGASESGFDDPAARVPLTVTAGNVTGNITLFTNVGAPDPNEPNNSRATATAAGCQVQKSGGVVPLNDVDYYSVTIAAATHLSASISAAQAGSSLDAVLGVFNAGGTLLSFDDNDVTLDPSLSVDLLTPGTYYVAVASYNDAALSGSGGQTVGSYTLSLTCTLPPVQAGTCPGKVLYAGNSATGALLAISDPNHDLTFDGRTTVYPAVGTGQSQLVTRRDGTVVVARQDGTLVAVVDATGDYHGEAVIFGDNGFGDGGSIALLRRGGEERFFVAGAFTGSGTILERLDADGDLVPEQETIFTSDPESAFALSVDEAGTVYVLDLSYNQGMGAILAYRDDDGDGVADRSSVFFEPALPFTMIAARARGEVFVSDFDTGAIERLRDRDGDGTAEESTLYASGLSLDVFQQIAIDSSDVVYAVDSDNRVVALPDADHNGTADAVVPFSPIETGYAGLGFGARPPWEVSSMAALVPFQISPDGAGIKLTWEDLGPSVGAYNVYRGALPAGSLSQVACGVPGVSNGAGGRTLSLPPDAGSSYYLVTASDTCGEGPFGRDSEGRLRALPASACGPH